MEGDALAFELRDAAIDMVLLDLEVGDAIAHQPASLALALVDVNVVAGPAKLLRSGHSGRPRANDGDAVAGLHGSGNRVHVAQIPSLVADRLLNRLDGNGHIFEVKRASLFARSRADAARPFGEIVSRVEVADRFFPITLIDQIIPVGDLVVNRTTRRPMAEGYAAIHAARGLLGNFLIRHRQHEFAEMPDAV